MKYLLTGATGFTGSHVLNLLREKGVSVRCYVRSPAKARELRSRGVETAIGDLSDVETFAAACAGCDVLLNLASLGFGHADGIVRAAEKSGIDRAVFISTTAIFTALNAPSKSVRMEAEAAIRMSALKWTILRPTMIYGTDGDRNISRLIRFLRRAPVLPIFGSGKYLMQPIYVQDLAAAVFAAARSSPALCKEYNVSGREPLSYNELATTITNLLGKKVKLLHLPPRPIVAVLRQCERFRLRLPIKAEQILRLNEDKAFAWEQAGRDFGFSPRSFAEGVAAEIRSMDLSAG